MIMPNPTVDLSVENTRLRALIEADGLRVDVLWTLHDPDARRENVRLLELLKWVRAYHAMPERARLELQGYLYPPVEQGYDPDADWMQFERWMKGLPLRWAFATEYGQLPDEDTLDDAALDATLQRMEAWLAARGVVVELQSNLPPRVAYRCLQKELLEEPFEYMPKGCTCHVTACSGYCPGCLQRPWCESGLEEEWPEDEEAGRMVCPDDVIAHMPRRGGD